MTRFDRWANNGPKGSEAQAIEESINQTMGDMLRSGQHRLSAPSSMIGPPTVRPKPAPVTEKPVLPPPGISIIDALVNSELPHGSKSRAK